MGAHRLIGIELETARWVLVIAALVFAGCAVDNEHPAYGDSSGQDDEQGEGGSSSDDSSAPGKPACDEGVVRECKIVIHQANGVESCWAGVEECTDGAWGRCTDEEFENPTSETQ